MAAAVDAARADLGPVGVCLPVSFASTSHADLQREAVRRLEHAGYQSVWTNEVIGKDAFVQLGVLLAATERMVFGTCIANIWARPAQTMHAAAAQLAQAYPGRIVAGLGVGYPEQAASTGREFGSPLVTMRDYLNQMDSPTWPPGPTECIRGSSPPTGRKWLRWPMKSPTGRCLPGCPRRLLLKPARCLDPTSCWSPEFR
jgi:alkanesulfonate monooxygenase SsuD/methylene tetrahydromethanopterin reductase-like flavin-dependent oxidoreductase (luciferase family)